MKFKEGKELKMKPIPKVKIAIVHKANMLYVYEDGVVALSDKNSWTEFYNNGKIRKFLNEDPVGGYFFSAKTYDGFCLPSGESLCFLINLVKKHSVISLGK